MFDSIKRFLGFYDSRGLRFSLAHLKAVFPRIAFMPLHAQAEYADIVTVRGVNYNSVFLKITMDNLLSHIEDGCYDFEAFNTTMVGNLAYAALHHKDKSIRARCFVALGVYQRHVTKKREPQN